MKMRKRSYVIVAIFVLSILTLLGCDSEGNTKGTPTNGYSKTLSQSKKNGVFQFEVKSDKPIFSLSKALKFEIKNAWVENTWSRKHYIFGTPPIMKSDSSYQLIMNLHIIIDSLRNKDSYFYFIGNKALDTFIHYNFGYKNRIDSIKVPLYREMSLMLPSRKERKAFDSILFIKQLSSH